METFRFEVSKEGRLVGKDAERVKQILRLRPGDRVLWCQHTTTGSIIIAAKELPGFRSVKATRIYSNRYYLTSIPLGIRAIMNIGAGDVVVLSPSLYDGSIVFFVETESKHYGRSCRVRVLSGRDMPNVLSEVSSFLGFSEDDEVEVCYCEDGGLRHVVVRVRMSDVATMFGRKLRVSPPILEDFDPPEGFRYRVVILFDRFIRKVRDIKPLYEVIRDSLYRVKTIWLATPSSYHHSYLMNYFIPELQDYNVGKFEEDTIIVYVNPSDPAWVEKFLCVLIHEFAHQCLSKANYEGLRFEERVFVEETAAYFLQFRLGYHRHYEGLFRAVEQMLRSRIICGENPVRMRMLRVHLPAYAAYMLKDIIPNGEETHVLAKPKRIIAVMRSNMGKHPMMGTLMSALSELGLFGEPKGVFASSCERLRAMLSELKDPFFDEGYLRGAKFWEHIGEYIRNGDSGMLRKILGEYPRLVEYFDIDDISRTTYQFIRDPRILNRILAALGHRRADEE